MDLDITSCWFRWLVPAGSYGTRVDRGWESADSADSIDSSFYKYPQSFPNPRAQGPKGALYIPVLFWCVSLFHHGFIHHTSHLSHQVVLMLARLPIGKLALLGWSPVGSRRCSLMGGIREKLCDFWGSVAVSYPLEFSWLETGRLETWRCFSRILQHMMIQNPVYLSRIDLSTNTRHRCRKPTIYRSFS